MKVDFFAFVAAFDCGNEGIWGQNSTWMWEYRRQ